jgi:hypothetical protein
VLGLLLLLLLPLLWLLDDLPHQYVRAAPILMQVCVGNLHTTQTTAGATGTA